MAVDQPHCNYQDFKIALDVGHTAEASGALSARGVSEYAFNLSLAERIAQVLKDGGFSHTHLLTTKGVGKSQLIQRSARANELQVDLFISVHHDDVQRDITALGNITERRITSATNFQDIRFLYPTRTPIRPRVSSLQGFLELN